jgi:histidine triad (HIT) family protein
MVSERASVSRHVVTVEASMLAEPEAPCHDRRMACTFCEIIAGEQPADVVLATDDVVAFLDRRPVFKGHVLLVPRQHVHTLTDLPDELVVPLMTATRTLARAVVDGLDAQGSFVAMNNVVSQSVAHLHVHVVPRTKGDGLRGFFWPRTKYADGEAQEYAARLRAVLSRD